MTPGQQYWTNTSFYVHTKEMDDLIQNLGNLRWYQAAPIQEANNLNTKKTLVPAKTNIPDRYSHLEKHQTDRCIASELIDAQMRWILANENEDFNKQPD